MRRINGSMFVSLDGIYQAPGGATEDPTGGFALGGWVAPHFDEAGGAAIGALLAEPFDLLLGRRTYDIFAGYWPYATDADSPIATMFNGSAKHVLTRGQADLPWANSHRLDGMDALAALKATDGPDLLMQGSGTLYPALLAAGLLDRLTLMTFPVVLGGGKRLFVDGTPPGTLRLVDHQVTPSGVVITAYEPAGAVETGLAGPQITSEREQSRQHAMAAGRW